MGKEEEEEGERLNSVWSVQELYSSVIHAAHTIGKKKKKKVFDA